MHKDSVGINDEAEFSAGYRCYLSALLLVAVTFIAYQQVWNAGFIWDDDKFLLKNPLIRMPDGLYRFWFTASSPDYFPMTSTTLWLEWRLWGDNPLGYHLINVFVHSLSSVLWWRVLIRLNIPGAWLAAALFALHPVNVESVAWITERKNILAMFFYVLTLLWYLRFDDTKQRLWYLISLIAFVFALLSKTAVVPLPVVLLGLAWWRRGTVERRDIWRSIPFFSAAMILGIVTVWFQYNKAIGSDIIREDSFGSRLVGAGWTIWFYLYKALLPLNLNFVYPRWQINAANLLSYVPGFFVVAGLWVCWYYRSRWGKVWLFGLGYFVVMLLPTLGFLNIYFMRYSLVADHWQYFSIIGPIALVAAGITRIAHVWENRSRLIMLVLCGVLLLVLGVLTWRQSGMYTDIETLWRKTIVSNPNSFMVHNNLGSLLHERGRVDEAIVHYKKAIEIQPDHFNAHINLAYALFQRGQTEEAIANFRRALEIQPGSADAYNNLAYVLQRLGRLDEAIDLYRKLLEIQPANAIAHSSLARGLIQKGRWGEAMEHYEMSLKLQPNDAAILHNYAWTLATCPEASVRNGIRAIGLAQHADRISGGRNPVILGTLAAAYAETRRFTEALITARKALQLASAKDNKKLVNTIRLQMKYYEAGSPFRDTAR